MRETATVGENAERVAAELLRPPLRAEASGLFLLMGQWLDRIVAGQKLGVFMSIMLIAVMMSDIERPILHTMCASDTVVREKVLKLIGLLNDLMSDPGTEHYWETQNRDCGKE